MWEPEGVVRIDPAVRADRLPAVPAARPSRWRVRAYLDHAEAEVHGCSSFIDSAIKG